MNTFDFVDKAAELGFEGIEYVSQFFQDKVEDDQYLARLKSKSEEVGLTNTMILVDVLDARLGASDSLEREKSISEHKKWI